MKMSCKCLSGQKCKLNQSWHRPLNQIKTLIEANSCFSDIRGKRQKENLEVVPSAHPRWQYFHRNLLWWYVACQLIHDTVVCTHRLKHQQMMPSWNTNMFNCFTTAWCWLLGLTSDRHRLDCWTFHRQVTNLGKLFTYVPWWPSRIIW